MLPSLASIEFVKKKHLRANSGDRIPRSSRLCACVSCISSRLYYFYFFSAMAPRTTRAAVKAAADAEKAAGVKVAEEPAAEEKIAEVKAVEELVVEGKAVEEKAPEETVTEEKVPEEKSPEEEVAAETAPEEKAAEKTVVEEKAGEETIAEEKVAEEEEKPTVENAAEEEPKKKAKTGVAVGDSFPNIGELECDEADKKVNLAEVLKDSGVVVFFYPRANTPGCQKQATGFNENLSRFEAAGYKVFGMSADKPKAQLSWKTKQGFKYTLLCDPSFQALKMLGVAKGSKSINRSHIVVEKGGKVIDLEYGVKPADSYTNALKTVEGK